MMTNSKIMKAPLTIRMLCLSGECAQPPVGGAPGPASGTVTPVDQQIKVWAGNSGDVRFVAGPPRRHLIRVARCPAAPGGAALQSSSALLWSPLRLCRPAGTDRQSQQNSSASTFPRVG